MTDDELETLFKTANRISDRIRRVLRDELRAMTGHIEPFQLLAGQLLPLVSFLRTVPVEARTPPSLLALREAAEQVLRELIDVERRLQTKG